MKNIKVLCALSILFTANIGLCAQLSDSLNTIQDKTLEMTRDYYKGARQTAIGDLNYLADFTGHTSEHILMVAEKSLAIIDVFEKAIAENTFYRQTCKDKLAFGIGLDRKTLVAAAIFHDSGMDKGGFVLDADGNVKLDNNGKAIKAVNGNDIRKNHALNSSINVLKNRQKLEKLGVNADMACLLCFAHSKSSSGIKDVARLEDWKKGFEKINRVLEIYNAEHSDKIYFNYKNLDDKNFMEKLVTGTLTIRLGDVSRDSNRHAKAQNGGEIVVYRSTVDNLAVDAPGEAKNARVYNYRTGYIKDLFSRQVHIGEQNDVFNRTVLDESGKVIHEMTIEDGNYAPHATFQNVIEHAGELASAPDADIKIRIIFNNNVEKKFVDIYNEMRETCYQGMGDRVVKIIYPWDNE